MEDKAPMPARVWNRIPDDIRTQIVEMAIEYCDLSPRELAVKFTDDKQYFVSEVSVYRLLKLYDLITSPTHIVMKAADEWEKFYNFHRPYGAFNGKTPYEALREKLKQPVSMSPS